MTDQKNTFIAIALSLFILIGWQMFFPPPAPPPSTEAPAASAPPAAPGSAATQTVAPTASGAVALPSTLPPVSAQNREEAVSGGDRIEIETPHVSGSLSLVGARIDDITLPRYRETVKKDSAPIDLLSPHNSPKPYYADLGWLSSDPAVALPGAATRWTQVGDNRLTDTQPVVLEWDNGAGLKFTRTIHADKNYMFTVEQTVENTSGAEVTVFPYALVARVDEPVHEDIYLLHEGPLGVFNGTLKEFKYDNLKEDQPRETFASVGGWVGITDKYWLTALAFEQSMPVTASINYALVNNRDRFQTDLRGDAMQLAPGEKKSVTTYVFAGAKEVELLDEYSENLGIKNFNLAIDFGWFWFLTIPFLHALIWLRGIFGNFGVAILAFTVLLRLLAYPLATKQFEAMSKMKKLQPEMQRLQQKYASDRVKLQQEMMDLYKREKANPLTGCLPILIQIPVFFALYKVLYVSIEMRHAPFFGWIHDLSAKDPTSILNLFGLFPYEIPAFLAFLSIGAWPLIYGITMYIQTRLNPQPADPIQAKVFQFLPILFTFLLATFPAGLVIYWAWSNILGMAQQWVIMRRMGVKV